MISFHRKGTQKKYCLKTLNNYYVNYFVIQELDEMWSQPNCYFHKRIPITESFNYIFDINFNAPHD